MAIRILLIRAINVGGTAKLPMARLRALLEELGATRARTYIASGNAVAEVPGDAAAFDRALEEAIEAEFGWRREVISRSPDELRAALAAHPFDVVEQRFSYVCPLTAAPDAVGVRAASELPRGDDEWAVIGADLHLRFAAGAGRAQLDTTRMLKALGVQGTARNLRTIAATLELADETAG